GCSNRGLRPPLAESFTGFGGSAMLGRLREVWLPWVLFGLTVALAAALLLAVLLAPWLEGLDLSDVAGRLLGLFARDAVVRRAAGVRPASLSSPPRRAGGAPPPNQIAGA